MRYAEVSVRTIIHHVKASWDWVPTAERYFFCDDAECDVAYFGADDTVILKSQKRVPLEQLKIDHATAIPEHRCEHA